jgi:ATP-dependent 26S proteasome regulatory subunit
MNVSPDVNFEELARSTDDFNAAQVRCTAHTVVIHELKFRSRQPKMFVSSADVTFTSNPHFCFYGLRATLHVTVHVTPM